MNWIEKFREGNLPFYSKISLTTNLILFTENLISIILVIIILSKYQYFIIVKTAQINIFHLLLYSLLNIVIIIILEYFRKEKILFQEKKKFTIYITHILILISILLISFIFPSLFNEPKKFDSNIDILAKSNIILFIVILFLILFTWIINIIVFQSFKYFNEENSDNGCGAGLDRAGRGVGAFARGRDGAHRRRDKQSFCNKGGRPAVVLFGQDGVSCEGKRGDFAASGVGGRESREVSRSEHGGDGCDEGGRQGRDAGHAGGGLCNGSAGSVDACEREFRSHAFQPQHRQRVRRGDEEHRARGHGGDQGAQCRKRQRERSRQKRRADKRARHLHWR